MRETVAIFWGGTLYAGLILGILLFFGRELQQLARQIWLRGRLSAAKKRFRKPGRVLGHLDQMLRITLGLRSCGFGFLLFTLLLCGGVFMVGLSSMPFVTAFSAGVLIAGLPYLMLRVRLESIRRRSSFEGETFVGNFLSAYRISHFNIYKTMEEMGKGKQQAKICTDLIQRMLYELRGTANPEEVKRATDRFAFAINTNWSRMFAYNLGLAALDGTNVSLALEDVLIQLREAKAASEERKRMNAEATRMAVFLMPGLYLATMVMAVKYVGISPERLFRNQLFSDQGFLMLLLALFLFFANLILVEAVNHRRFDY